VSNNSNNRDDGVYFTIKEVADQVGVVPATIRNWEKSGVFNAKRSPSGYRIYTMEDIDLLKRVHHLSVNENMGMTAIARFINAGFYNNRPKSEANEEPVSKKLISQKWKTCRIERGYSLEDVASSIDISSSYLSKIENGLANVSFEILKRLASFYGENILYYLDNETDNERMLVRKGTGDIFSIGLEGVAVESVVALKQHTLSVMVYTVEPGSGRTLDTGHSGEEFVHVLAGRIKFQADGSEFMMNKGDSITFRSHLPHGWQNCGRSEAKLLWVYTPLIGDL